MSDKKIKRRGLMLVLSSPSGAGKTTLAKMLIAEEKHLHTSISYTTRSPRANEKNGQDYYFVTEEEFARLVAEDFFLEWAQAFGNFYGTPRHIVEDYIAAGEDVLFDIDWQGHKALQTLAAKDVVSVFILPPSKLELKARLERRAQATNESIALRIEKANAELVHWSDYDYTIVNKELQDSLQKLQAILKAERLRKNRRMGVVDFVQQLLDEEL